MDERKLNIAALIGFMVSSTMFLIAALRSGDTLTTVASAVWLGSCGVWILPLLVRRG